MVVHLREEDYSFGYCASQCFLAEETNVHVLFGFTAIYVGDEHGWEIRRLFLYALVGLFRRATGHGDRGTVHIHLTIPNTIEPRPG